MQDALTPIETPQNSDSGSTACIILADGSMFYGTGFGAAGHAAGELCFNTSMTGYQEIMTDPSYAGQIVTFTFPHIGIVGSNHEDNEARAPAAAGIVVKWRPGEMSNWRAVKSLSDWLAGECRIGIGGIDTRRLTRTIRRLGAPNAVIAHSPEAKLDPFYLRTVAEEFPGIEGMDLAQSVSCTEPYDWSGTRWKWGKSYSTEIDREFRVAAIDYGAKKNILRCLASLGCAVRVFPAASTAKDIVLWEPDGVFLSNGPGDPAATGKYAIPMIRGILQETNVPVFGICLGHQLLALALGARTVKMNHGHHGANHPVKDLETGKVEITSMNHGFTVDTASLPVGVIETHRSLFDASNCGIKVTDRPTFSVQFHPEASPGPQDSFYLFQRFVDAMRKA